jgi:hypothetical protein
MSDDSDKKDRDEQTSFGGGPPAAPKLPGAPAKQADSTQVGGAPPVAPPRPPGPAGAAPAAPAQPAAPAPSRPADATAPPPNLDEEKTVLVVRDTNRPRVTLSRVRPAGHSDTVALGPRDAYVVGRAPTSDVRLYSPNASREHARLTRRGAAWFLAPTEGKTVLANGALVRDEVQLEHRMRLQLGEDELLVIDEAAAVDHGAARPVVAPATSSGGADRWWLIGSIIAAALIVLAAWVLARG